MSFVSVLLQDISKKYRLFNSPKDRFLEAIHPFNKKYHREFWALKDINLQIEKGMTVGIIGRNGSGKSTLLQIICSVLRPTTGTVTADGRISALLELGTGFNPEFTGRDNVLMNGVIMGFSREEMKKRMPIIESFADIAGFIDQPVKFYSSGMFLRLAFAAAINVDPDILVVDEALAVGDAKFQHKCFQKFIEFQNKGKTIIFVTHDINAVIKHCDHAILLEKGEIIEQGEPKVIANYYIDLLVGGELFDYASSPILSELGYRGFNIVHYKSKYYGVNQSLGEMDFTHLTDAEIEKSVEEGKCVIGTSFEQVKKLIDETVSGCHREDDRIENSEETELDKFLADCTVIDNCINRKSYNKNEYRQRQGKAEIIDYLVVCGKQIDPMTIRSCDSVDLYIKARFTKYVQFPLFGFSIKTVDGLEIYAINSFFTKIFLPPAEKSEIITVKFSLEMKSMAGDIFIDIGVDESWNGGEHSFMKRQAAYDSLDRRCGVIHLLVREKNWFHGLADFQASFQEVARKQSNDLSL